MGTVYDPPLELVVIGYVWQRGNTSGGTREVFLSMAEAQRRLANLLATDEVKEPGKVQVFTLVGEPTWALVDVHLPEPLRLEHSDGTT